MEKFKSIAFSIQVFMDVDDNYVLVHTSNGQCYTKTYSNMQDVYNDIEMFAAARFNGWG